MPSMGTKQLVLFRSPNLLSAKGAAFEGRRSKVEGQRSKVEGQRSKVKGRRSKVKGTDSQPVTLKYGHRGRSVSAVFLRNLQICHRICKSATVSYPTTYKDYLQICRFFPILKITCSIYQKTKRLAETLLCHICFCESRLSGIVPFKNTSIIHLMFLLCSLAAKVQINTRKDTKSLRIKSGLRGKSAERRAKVLRFVTFVRRNSVNRCYYAMIFRPSTMLMPFCIVLRRVPLRE